MITTDATVSKKEKNNKKKVMERKDIKNHWKSQKNCKTNLKIKIKNRSTLGKLRKALEKPQSI